MKKLFSILCLLISTLVLHAQKVINDPNAEVRNVGSFTGINVSGGIDVYLSTGNEALAVSASKPEYKERIKTEVENGVLRIWYDSKMGISLNSDRRLKAYVSYKTLKSLEASGGSDIRVDGTIASEELVMRISGGSDFVGKVEAAKLTVRQSGGSDVNISGRATSLTVDASGGSDFNGYDLVAEVCDLEASGACDIEVTASRVLSARASGASDISYKGSPTVKEAKSSGASSVKNRS
ncbi:MAG: DUF2807 domain-containing protein [Bacteroidota bacterium]|nr:DUF2807 domain-containing protein [Bacteroidota bacterium]